MESNLLLEQYSWYKKQQLAKAPFECLLNADIEPNPHHVNAFCAAIQALKTGGIILADEVGLGKTIEAGLVLNYVLDNGAKKVLISLPATLRKQWEVELFTRVDAPDPDADEQTNIVYLNKGKTEKWLPAAEVHGEGVFIEFNRDSIDAWLRDPELGALSQKYAQCYKEFCESKEWTVTTLRDARYVLMHTFAHLLIKQMSMSSGYSSSAIRERIYFGDDMSGVLLYTGSADKEGSLGGLVELGNIDQLIVLMKDAFQEALVCTNDPECLNNVPAGNNSNGAACHSCCMISETACENGNRMLDRGLIVPIDGRENQSYFKTLVEELCQLEV